MKTYYKVVRRLNGPGNQPLYVSSGVSVASNWVTTYHVGKWTQAEKEGTKLFIFESLKDAGGYTQKTSGDLSVFHCEAEEVVRPSFMSVCTASCIGYFWDASVKSSFIAGMPDVRIPPKGTLWASRVKLTKEVSTFEWLELLKD